MVDKGPWLIHGNRPLMLRRWEDGRRMDMRSFEKVPVRVKIPNLHPWFRSTQMIVTIRSMIGEPVCLDGVTSRNIKRNLAFARLLVEVSATDISRKVAILQHSSGEEFIIPIEFEWIHWHCSHCSFFGHTTEFCPHKPRKELIAA